MSALPSAAACMESGAKATVLMADREKQIRLFRRIADQRLIAAEFLLQNGFSLEAVYLAGYTVECALKALVLRWTPRTNFETVLEQLTEVGAKGHDFEYLKGLLKERRRGGSKTDHTMLGALAAHLKNVTSWSTNLRYQVGVLKPKVAREFVEATRTIRDTCAGG